MQTAQPIGEALGVHPEAPLPPPPGAALRPQSFAVEVWVDVHETGGMYHSEADEEQSGMSRDQMQEVPLPPRARTPPPRSLTRAVADASRQDFPGFVLPTQVYKSGWWFGGREDRVIHTSICITHSVHLTRTLLRGSRGH